MATGGTAVLSEYVYKSIHLAENHLAAIKGEKFSNVDGTIDERLERAIHDAWAAAQYARMLYQEMEARNGTSRDNAVHFRE